MFTYKQIRTFHTDKSRPFFWSCIFNQVSHSDTSEKSRRDACCAPRESLAFFDLVLFFPPVSSANKSNWTSDLLIIRDELPKGDCQWLFNQSMKSSSDFGNEIFVSEIYPSTVNSQSGISWSSTLGTGP